MQSSLLRVLFLATAGAQAQYWDSGWNPPWLGGSGDGSGSDGSGSGSGSSGSGQGSSSGGGGGSNGFGPFQDGAGFDIDQAMSIRQIHGILAAVAFVGLFPIGAILMRVVPGRLTWIIHGVFQILAYCVYIAAAALGIVLVRLVRIPPDGASMANTHPIIGLVVLGVLFFQPLFGWLHHVRLGKTGRRTAWSHLHLWLGRSAIVLGIINGGFGLELADASDSAITAYSVVAAIVCLLWLLSALLFEYRRWRASRKAAPEHAFAPPPAYDVPPPLYSYHHLP
ncbi:Integral membrane protein [Apiospora sp. TS-2023a]